MKPDKQRSVPPETGSKDSGFIGGLAEMADADLLRLRASLEAEARRRGIPIEVGDVGEQLAIDYFNATPGLPKLQVSQTGTKNVDANSRQGERYSIKTICRGKKTGTIYTSPDDPDRQLFEYLLIVHLDEMWTLKSIHQMTWRTFCQVRSRDTRMTAWYVGVSKHALSSASLIFPKQKTASA